MVKGWALQGPEPQEPVIQPLKTQYRTKLGSAEPTHLGGHNNRGVHIKMLIGLPGGGEGGFYIATPLVLSLYPSRQDNATPHSAKQVQGHQRGLQHL